MSSHSHWGATVVDIVTVGQGVLTQSLRIKVADTVTGDQGVQT